MVSSVTTRPLSLAKCTPPPTFATRLVVAPGPAGAGAQVFSLALLGLVLRGLICFSRISSSPRGWKAEMRILSLGVFIIEREREREALALNLLDETRDSVSPPPGSVTASSTGLSFLVCKMALTLLPYRVIMKSEIE